MIRRPPHILVTTPESLYLLLTAESGRRMLATVQTVIVDEIHAVAATKRGAHLSLSLERLRAVTGAPFARISLSATQKPVPEIARFLAGTDAAGCTIVDIGHVRDRDLALELPDTPLDVDALRALRKMPPTGTLVSLSAADPLNLAGIITPGERVLAVPGNRVLYRDGIPVAARIGPETRFFGALGPASEWEAHNALLRTNTPLLAGRLN